MSSVEFQKIIVYIDEDDDGAMVTMYMPCPTTNGDIKCLPPIHEFDKMMSQIFMILSSRNDAINAMILFKRQDS